MKHLNPAKLHTHIAPEVHNRSTLIPRCYTLTHSDSTGELFLTIGLEIDRAQISRFYTRLMRDEVLAEWVLRDQTPELHVHCHVSGGLILGTAGWRYAIFRQHLPLVVEAIRFGDAAFISSDPQLEAGQVIVEFHAKQARYHHHEAWGVLSDYR